jgi:UTP--glucose-1-phosphate uridylyltransferase
MADNADATTRRISKAVIPAAGRGTRFLPFTKAVPKELAPMVTTPTVELVVAEATAHGVTDVLVVLARGKEAVVDYFDTDPDLEAVLQAKGDDATLAAVRRAGELASIHSVEQGKPRGLGDAVAHGEEFSSGEPIAVLLPDEIIDERDDLLGPMLDVYAEHGGVVIGLADVPRQDIRLYGCVVPAEGSDPAGDVVRIADMVEKPQPDEAPSTLAITGRYLLPPEIFDALRNTEPGSGGEIQLTDAMRRLAHDGVPVHGVVFRGRRYDTGNRLEYVKAVVQFAERHEEIGADFSAWLHEHVAAKQESAGA